jgi:hypothetical protein
MGHLAATRVSLGRTWTLDLRALSCAAYAGRAIKLRFTGQTKGISTSDMALDAIELSATP